MDDVKPPAPRNFDDVTRPGSIPAAPSSNPVIVGNQTVQTDPMMAAVQPQSAPPTIPVQPPMSTREMPINASTDETSNTIESSTQEAAQPDAAALGNTALTENVDQPPTLESVHKISHDQAFFGQMKPPKSKFKKFLIFIFVLLIMGCIGYGAWYLLNKSEKAVTDTPTPVVVEEKKIPAEDSASSMATYENKSLGFKFEYPTDWGDAVEENKAENEKSGIFALTFSKAEALKYKVQLRSNGSNPVEEKGYYNGYIKELDKYYYRDIGTTKSIEIPQANILGKYNTSLGEVLLTNTEGFSGNNLLFGEVNLKSDKFLGLGLSFSDVSNLSTDTSGNATGNEYNDSEVAILKKIMASFSAL